ncbi:MAG: HAD-IIB family hydrolase [Nakamurella sp.]
MNPEPRATLTVVEDGTVTGVTAETQRALVRAVIFDLDDTLAPSKSRLADSTAALVERLLENVDVCIISGGSFDQFKRQVLQYLPSSPVLARLHLMPTCGTEYYRWRAGSWCQIYSEVLGTSAKQLITSVLAAGVRELGFDDLRTWGATIEDRGTQITYSALGQEAPIDAKMAWDPDGSKRRRLHAYAAPKLSDFEVRVGGSTSIDVTNKGIDKAYGVTKLQHELHVDIEELLFLGDRLDVDGNDYPVKAMGVKCIEVTGWRDTERQISSLLRAGIGVDTVPDDVEN